MSEEKRINSSQPGEVYPREERWSNLRPEGQPPPNNKDPLETARTMAEEALAVAKGMNARFIHSTFFRDACEQAFHDVDIDDSGSLDKAELWAAWLLMVHELNSRLPVTLNPPNKTVIARYFNNYAVDGDGKISKKQFIAACQWYFSFSEDAVYPKVLETLGVQYIAPMIGGYFISQIPVLNWLPMFVVTPIMSIAGSAALKAPPREKNIILSTIVALLLVGGIKVMFRSR